MPATSDRPVEGGLGPARWLPGEPPGPVPDDELAARRERLLDEAERLGLDAVVGYGANRSGSAVPWLTCWQVTREAVVVLRRGERPTLLVGFPNHVPNARRVAHDCDVAGVGEATAATVLDVLRRGPARRIGVVGAVPHRLWVALSEGVELVSMEQSYVAARMNKTPLRAVGAAERGCADRRIGRSTRLGRCAGCDGARPGRRRRGGLRGDGRHQPHPLCRGDLDGRPGPVRARAVADDTTARVRVGRGLRAEHDVGHRTTRGSCSGR